MKLLLLGGSGMLGSDCREVLGEDYEIIAPSKKDLDIIKDSCQKYLDNRNIDGILFNYYHFLGDYEHYLPFHGWYKNEMRIVRNFSKIYSYKDAQSFRKNNNEKLNPKFKSQ